MEFQRGHTLTSPRSQGPPRSHAGPRRSWTAPASSHFAGAVRFSVWT
jgi:hypothetical protein